MAGVAIRQTIRLTQNIKSDTEKLSHLSQR